MPILWCGQMTYNPPFDSWCRCPENPNGEHLEGCSFNKKIVIDIYNNPLHGEIFRSCLRLANSIVQEELVNLRDQLSLAIAHSNCYCDKCKKLTGYMFYKKKEDSI